MKVLNILNGDATLYKFKQASLPGDVLVWREVLSEGPVSAVVPEKEFFTMRANWIAEAFDPPYAEYEKKVMDEYNKLQNYTGYDELIFWFEYDLHCQVNLIFLLSKFAGKDLGNTTISLICPDHHPNHQHFGGIGQLTPGELEGLLPEKINLTQFDLKIASSVWKAYCSGRKDNIVNILSTDTGQLDKLKPALNAHLDRFVNPETGLSKLERSLIDMADLGVQSRKDLYEQFWKNNLIYGMGDAAIDLYLDKLIREKQIRPLD